MSEFPEAGLNSRLANTHNFYFLLYLSICAFTLLLALAASGSARWSYLISAAISAAACALHWCAAKGVKRGKPWSRTMSKVLGYLLLINIPIGTIMGIFILMRVGKQWESEEPAFESEWTQ